MSALGNKQELHVTVSEPEPGRVMVESDAETGLTTTFTVEPVDEGRSSRVTIAAEATPSPGPQGWIERMVTPGLIWDELRLLEKYMHRIS